MPNLTFGQLVQWGKMLRRPSPSPRTLEFLERMSGISPANPK
jgi:hypothetical protein